MVKFWNRCISEWEGWLTLHKGCGSRSFMTMTVTIWWLRSGVWIYQIVTGVTSVVGVPSTHLVYRCCNRCWSIIVKQVLVYHMELHRKTHKKRNHLTIYKPIIMWKWRKDIYTYVASDTYMCLPVWLCVSTTAIIRRFVSIKYDMQWSPIDSVT